MEVIVAFFLFALLFLRGLCVESVLQAKLVALAYHMWKHSHHLPGQKKLGRDRWEEGVRVREIENKVCVWVRGRERNPFCSYHLTSAKIKVRSEPKTHLKNLSAVSPFSPANMTHFYPRLPSLSSLSLSLFVIPSVLFGCQSKNLLDPSCFSKCIVFIVFASLSYALPSVLRSALSTLCILTLFTLSAANFPPYPSPYLQ